jgi:hypothetical protein
MSSIMGLAHLLRAILRVRPTYYVQGVARAAFRWDIKRRANRIIRRFVLKTVLRKRWHKLRILACDIVQTFLLDVRKSRGVCLHIHKFRTRVIKIQRTIRDFLAFTRNSLRDQLPVLEQVFFFFLFFCVFFFPPPFVFVTEIIMMLVLIEHVYSVRKPS